MSSRSIVCVEGLEPRRLLSSSFASVGFAWNATWPVLDVDMFATEGELAEDGGVQGLFYGSGDTERELIDDLWYDSVLELPLGRFDRDPPEGFYGDPDERNGARFWPVDRYPVGWWHSDYGDSFPDSGEDAELLVTLDGSTTLADYLGTYQYTEIWHRFNEDNPFDDPETRLSNGRMTVSQGQISWTPARGSEHRVSSGVDRVNAFGALITTRGEYFYLAADGSTIVYADLADDDEVVSIGVATRATDPIDADSLAGVYLTLFCEDPDQAPEFRQRVIELDEDGDYALFDLDEYDDGSAEPLETGEWSVVGDRAVLEEHFSGVERSFALGDNGSTLLATEVREDGIGDPIFALGVRVLEDPVPHEPIFNVSARDEVDRPQIFQLETDDIWYVVDVVATIGGPVPVGDVVSWVDPKDGLSYGAAVTSQGIVLYTEGEDDTWSFRNLTDEVLGELPAGELDVMIGPDGIVHLTALATDNDLLHYAQSGVRNEDGSWRWTFENITEEDLAPAGLDTPDFGGLVSYATAWNGLNVVGLDEEGEIWSVWTAPGRDGWTVSNLTSAYGAEPLAGGLTVYLTPWGGINLAGIDGAGHLRVTWWVPSFGGEWAQSDLTAVTGGPLYAPEQLGSFVSAWGGLNIVGADRATGEVIVTWWSPARTEEGWAAVSLSDAVPNGSPIIAAPFSGIAAPDESLNVFGYAGTDFVRYFWEPSFDGAWQVQNLTQIAVMR